MKRHDISRLEKNRSIYMKIGFVIAVCFAIMAFNFTVYDKPESRLKTEEIPQDIFDPVVRTPRKTKPELQPPAIEPTDNIIPDDPDFTENLMPDTLVSEIIVDTVVHKVAQPTIPANPPKPPVIKPEPPKETAPPIFFVVEEMPRFPGCETKEIDKNKKAECARAALLAYIYANINYPAMAVENNIEGTVVAQFVVEPDGSISELKIVKDIGAGCGQEVKRIVSNMPAWIPGKQRNTPVRVRFTIPVKFELK